MHVLLRFDAPKEILCVAFTGRLGKLNRRSSDSWQLEHFC